jgi:aryl-alcohol dehydrogenase-like predicted oxidoreductase
MRLAIGTAQFGLSYGVSNSSGQVSSDNASQILALASKMGLDTIDTASVYGTSEEVLGTIGVQDWRVISKISGMPVGVTDVKTWVVDQVKNSLDRLKIQSLDAVLLHKPTDLLGDSQADYLAAFEVIKTQNLASSIGYSVYSPQELAALCDVYWPDIVQTPFNILDRRIEKSGWLDRLNERGTRVHARSVFLQGLLLMEPQDRPSWFVRWREQLNKWDQLCVDSRRSAVALALDFVLNEPGIERAVVGVVSKSQLVELLSVQDAEGETAYPDIDCDDLELIEPFRWKLK